MSCRRALLGVLELFFLLVISFAREILGKTTGQEEKYSKEYKLIVTATIGQKKNEFQAITTIRRKLTAPVFLLGTSRK